MLLKEEFEDTKGVNRSYKSKMNSQNNGQKKKEKKTNTTTKDRATRTQLTSGSELRCFVGESSSCSTCCTHCVTTYDMLSLKENNLLNFNNKVFLTCLHMKYNHELTSQMHVSLLKCLLVCQ